MSVMPVDNQRHEPKTKPVSEALRIRINLLSHLGVAVQLVDKPQSERHIEPDRPQEVIASIFCDDRSQSQVPLLSPTHKIALLKSIAAAIRKTREARYSDETGSPILGLIGSEISPLPGTTRGAS